MYIFLPNHLRDAPSLFSILIYWPCACGIDDASAPLLRPARGEQKKPLANNVRKLYHLAFGRLFTSTYLG